ncbi:hypothetical protein ACNKHU_16840 [Shigella flexneri]
MRDVTGPIRNMVNTVDRIVVATYSRVGRIYAGELDMLKNGINSMAMLLAAYHEEMQHNRPGDVRFARNAGADGNLEC